MESEKDQIKCQIGCLPIFFEGYAKVPPESLRRKIRLFIRRNLNSKQVRKYKLETGKFITQIAALVGGHNENIKEEINDHQPKINTGDFVRIRPEDEIQATLNHWGQLKGCMFMPDMLPYCGTVQKVYKRMERFVDERDYYVKKTNGIILLVGLNCQGTSDYGRCDRACFYFWREEWLEKITEEEYQSEKHG